jgi:RimJ/RimL family protein N-acetyltransferase
MELTFRKIDLPSERAALIDWLSSQRWPYHGNTNLSPERVEEMIREGIFSGPNHQSFWIFGERPSPIGFIRLFDLDDIADGTPMFDIRLAPEFRGKGVGHKAVSWLVRYMFENWPELHRIEGSTRHDNWAMRRVFEKCGFVQEGHLRQAWRTKEGRYFDAILCGILRSDWDPS